jgi:hypothetical protein
MERFIANTITTIKNARTPMIGTAYESPFGNVING